MNRRKRKRNLIVHLPDLHPDRHGNQPGQMDRRLLALLHNGPRRALLGLNSDASLFVEAPISRGVRVSCVLCPVPGGSESRSEKEPIRGGGVQGKNQVVCEQIFGRGFCGRDDVTGALSRLVMYLTPSEFCRPFQTFCLPAHFPIKDLSNGSELVSSNCAGKTKYPIEKNPEII